MRPLYDRAIPATVGYVAWGGESRRALTGHWYFVESWRELPNGVRVAHVKHLINDAIRAIITDHGGDPDSIPPEDLP